MRRSHIPLLFSYDSIPELSHVPREERLAFWGRAVKGRGSHWPEWIAFGAGLAGIMIASRVARHAPFWSASIVTRFLLVLVCAMVWGIAGVNVVYRRVRARLRADLAAAGRCASCGYDLYASPERCPECGASATAGHKSVRVP